MHIHPCVYFTCLLIYIFFNHKQPINFKKINPNIIIAITVSDFFYQIPTAFSSRNICHLSVYLWITPCFASLFWNDMLIPWNHEVPYTDNRILAWITFLWMKIQPSAQFSYIAFLITTVSTSFLLKKQACAFCERAALLLVQWGSEWWCQPLIHTSQCSCISKVGRHLRATVQGADLSAWPSLKLF